MSSARSLCLAVVGLVAATAQPADLPDDTLLGILRADNFVTPIARYRQGRWRGPTYEQMSFGGIVPSENIGPVPPAWFLSRQPLPSRWFRAAGLGDPINVVRPEPVQMPNHCQLTWVIAVEGPGQPTPEHYLDHGNIGIVLSKDVPFAAADRLMFEAYEPPWNSTPEARQFAELIREPMLAAEKSYRPHIGNYDERTAPVKREPPVLVYSLRRVALESQVLWRVGALKKYRPLYPTHPSCEIVDYFSAWFAEDDRRELKLIQHDFVRTDCDAKEMETVTPLGLIRAGQRRFVVTEDHGYENESYSIREWIGDKIRKTLTIGGGGC